MSTWAFKKFLPKMLAPKFVLVLFFSDEGEYICPVTTVFGLNDEEIKKLIDNQAEWDLHKKLTDRNKAHDGIEIGTSCWKVS